MSADDPGLLVNSPRHLSGPDIHLGAPWYRDNIETRETGEVWPVACEHPVNIDPDDYPSGQCDRCGHDDSAHPDQTKALRKGARGPARDHATDRRVLEIREQLDAWKFAATAPQIAAVLSFERGQRTTADSVRARLRHHVKGQSGTP